MNDVLQKAYPGAPGALAITGKTYSHSQRAGSSPPGQQSNPTNMWAQSSRSYARASFYLGGIALLNSSEPCTAVNLCPKVFQKRPTPHEPSQNPEEDGESEPMVKKTKNHILSDGERKGVLWSAAFLCREERSSSR